MKINKNKLYVPAHQAVIDAQRRNIVADVRITTRRPREELIELVVRRIRDELRWGNLDGLTAYEDRDSGPQRIPVSPDTVIDLQGMSHADISALALALTWGTYAVRKLTLMGYSDMLGTVTTFHCQYWCYVEQNDAPRMRSFFQGVASSWYYAMACALLANRAYLGAKLMDSADPRALELRLSSTRTIDSLIASLNAITRAFEPLFNDDFKTSRPQFCRYIGTQCLPVPVSELLRSSHVHDHADFFGDMDSALAEHIQVPISLQYLASGPLAKDQVRHESDQLYSWHKGREYEVINDA